MNTIKESQWWEQAADRRVALLLSGGVDSSVALHELVAHGVSPDCFYIRIGPEEQLNEAEGAWDCPSEEDLEMASSVARRYGCRLEVVDCHREYWEQVTRYTMEKVRAGFTPNPDVMCNRLIKFGAFDEKAGHDYDLIATGHYAQTLVEDGKKWLTTSPDPVKDQTDFLAQIYDWQLKKALFPIGGMMKEEVRAVAERENLASAHRKDSQGICFLGHINYNDYVRQYLGEMPGNVVEWETGKVLGQHKGLWFHTIGQRKGLGLGGGPWNVIKKDMETNTLYVTKGYEPLKVWKRDFLVHDVHLLTPCELPATVTFKIRHTPEWHKAELERIGEQAYMVHSEALIQGVAPGQFCTLYDENFHRCFGSAEITIQEQPD
ncbi:MAG: tRNA 2-thiouridine(34) synthase MnmA [Prevotella sp.]|nr:tRNA 2-thiouridine(34) synthase MnmA [Prevotella sp.]